jgi:hypothetical protein
MAVVHFHHRSQARGTVVMAEHCLSRLHHFQISKLLHLVHIRLRAKLAVGHSMLACK